MSRSELAFRLRARAARSGGLRLADWMGVLRSFASLPRPRGTRLFSALTYAGDGTERAAPAPVGDSPRRDPHLDRRIARPAMGIII